MGSDGCPTTGSANATGPFWGALYSRSWITFLISVPLVAGIYFSILGGTAAWIVLAPLTVLIVGILWLVPLSIVSAQGIRFVLRGDVVAWSQVTSVVEPRPGDEEARIRLTSGRIVTVSGMRPDMAPALRTLLEARR